MRRFSQVVFSCDQWLKIRYGVKQRILRLSVRQQPSGTSSCSQVCEHAYGPRVSVSGCLRLSLSRGRFTRSTCKLASRHSCAPRSSGLSFSDAVWEISIFLPDISVSRTQQRLEIAKNLVLCPAPVILEAAQLMQSNEDDC